MEDFEQMEDVKIVKYNDLDYKTRRAISTAFVEIQKLRLIIYSIKAVDRAFTVSNAEFVISGGFLNIIDNKQLEQILINQYKLLY